MTYKSPVYNVRAVPIEKIVPNNYNPNSVAPPEMKLLYDSIKEDGYTMPIVCYYVKEDDNYVIVDGFHRYRVMLDYPDIRERENGMIPVAVIDKSIDNRMASTIRHNRARGSHDVDLMSNIIRELHELGRSDAWISKHLGMDKDEILRLKQLTGLTSLFKDVEFGQAWLPVEDDESAEVFDENELENCEEEVMRSESEKPKTAKTSKASKRTRKTKASKKAKDTGETNENEGSEVVEETKAVEETEKAEKNEEE